MKRYPREISGAALIVVDRLRAASVGQPDPAPISTKSGASRLNTEVPSMKIAPGFRNAQRTSGVPVIVISKAPLFLIFATQ
jgi:hypothetical protein